MEYIINLTIFPYVLAVVLASWITFQFIHILKPKKVIIPVAWGIILGIIWFFAIKPQIDLLILGFFAAAGLYDYIFKWIIKYFEK